MEKNVATQVLKSDKGIRWITIMDTKGKVLERKTREGLKLLVPENSKEKVLLQLVIMWDITEELDKYFGSLNRVVIHYEIVDLILLKMKDYFIGMSVDKNVKSDELAKRLKGFV